MGVGVVVQSFDDLLRFEEVVEVFFAEGAADELSLAGELVAGDAVAA